MDEVTDDDATFYLFERVAMMPEAIRAKALLVDEGVAS